jgi:hypothetical protein
VPFVEEFGKLDAFGLDGRTAAVSAHDEINGFCLEFGQFVAHSKVRASRPVDHDGGAFSQSLYCAIAYFLLLLNLRFKAAL